MQATPHVKDLVLLGGGHAHLAVLRRFGMNPVPGVRVTLVTRVSRAPYSGMLPGLIAGHYTEDDMSIDLRHLAAFAGARFVLAEVTGLDVEARRLSFIDRPPLEFDLLSLNVGITPSLADLAMPTPQLTPVKPLDLFSTRFMALRARVLESASPQRIGVIGGGAGGVELAFAINYRLRRELEARGDDPGRVSVHLLTASVDILPGQSSVPRRHVRAALAAAGIEVLTDMRVIRMDDRGVFTMTGRHVPLNEVLWVTGAAPSPWFAGSGLALDTGGYPRVSTTLQSVSHPYVFAAGDCAGLDGTPRPKAGVYAVRQGPVLAENLRRVCTGEPLREYLPQRGALALLATGPQHCIGMRDGWSIAGHWVWRWKNWIDRRFMRLYQQLPPMKDRPQPLPSGIAREVASLGPLAMRCGGCGAKVAARTLHAALDQLPKSPHDHIIAGLESADDAAVTVPPTGEFVLQSIDGFRSFIDDPFLFGEITAAHALSDIYAMGGTPQSALVYVSLPLASDALMRRDLTQALAGVNATLHREGASLVGGHTAEGGELTLALAVTGSVAPARLRRKRGARPGDALILTRALGTGVILAGAMRGLCRNEWLDAALASMRETNGPAARVLAGFDCHALTDITGFGLSGHLMELLRGEGLRARLDLSQLPLLDGALALMAQGVRSTLHVHNERLAEEGLVDIGTVDAQRLPLLFDPQTSGGLLAAVPPTQVEAVLAALHREHCPAARCIGSVIDHAGPPTGDLSDNPAGSPVSRG